MELKSCPFCGGNALVCEVDSEIDNKKFSGFVVACEDCGIGTPADDNEQKVINIWNKRVQ